MEDLEHVRWKLLRQEKMIFAKAGGYFRSQSVSVLAQCDVSLLTCLFASERRMPIVRIVENILQFKKKSNTLQGINISHLGKRKIIFKMPFLGDMLVPRRVVQSFCKPFHRKECKCSAPNTCSSFRCSFSLSHHLPKTCQRKFHHLFISKGFCVTLEDLKMLGP